MFSDSFWQIFQLNKMSYNKNYIIRLNKMSCDGNDVIQLNKMSYDRNDATYAECEYTDHCYLMVTMFSDSFWQ